MILWFKRSVSINHSSECSCFTRIYMYITIKAMMKIVSMKIKIIGTLKTLLDNMNESITWIINVRSDKIIRNLGPAYHEKLGVFVIGMITSFSLLVLSTFMWLVWNTKTCWSIANIHASNIRKKIVSIHTNVSITWKVW